MAFESGLLGLLDSKMPGDEIILKCDL